MIYSFIAYVAEKKPQRGKEKNTVWKRKKFSLGRCRKQ